MKVLKMIADWRYNFDENRQTRQYHDIPLNERDNNSHWYLDGKLEEFVRFDKATVTNCFSGGFARQSIRYEKITNGIVESLYNDDESPFYRMYFNGIVDVEIEGIPQPCVGYFYTADERQVTYKGKSYDLWEQRGLVCFKNDIESCKYAYEKMKTRSLYL